SLRETGWKRCPGRRRASRRSSSWRSWRGCPTGRCAASGACRRRGAPSAPTPASSGGRCRPSPASSATPSTTTTTGGLLCGCFTSPTPSSSLDIDYLVCNPATEEWTVLPRTQHMNLQSIIRLGFDPDDPCGFTVFLFEQDLYDGGTLTGLKIYSSETRTWASKQIGWSQGIHLDNSEESVSVFMNGVLHLHLPANNTLIVTWTWTARLGRHFGGHPLVMASGGLKDACTL
uniref:F-box associated domain-containing protein n=2 Tax=Aegilops tauschii subsp. strangulata TaxID=200361 RepID=A0A453DYT8_AEGTS